MDGDRLKEWLASADGPERCGKAVVAAEVRRAARGRVRQRRIMVASLVVGMSAAVLLLPQQKAGPGGSLGGGIAEQGSPVANRPGGELGRRDVAAEIDMLAQSITDRRRLRARARGMESVDIAEVREDAARTMVMTAPLRGEVAGRAEARLLYERTVVLYPDTESAAFARLELAREHPLQ